MNRGQGSIIVMRMNTLTFVASDSSETNDHQVRPWIDGRDWLGDDHLGLDPPKFFRQPALRSGGELIVGRCECGVVGCDDRLVTVERDRDFVFWRSGKSPALQFVASEYESELARAAEDFSWETVGRTAERLVDDALSGITKFGGYQFQWSSTRIRPNTLTLCFERNGDQKLIDVDWNGDADEETVEGARSAAPW